MPPPTGLSPAFLVSRLLFPIEFFHSRRGIAGSTDIDTRTPWVPDLQADAASITAGTGATQWSLPGTWNSHGRSDLRWVPSGPAIWTKSSSLHLARFAALHTSKRGGLPFNPLRPSNILRGLLISLAACRGGRHKTRAESRSGPSTTVAICSVCFLVKVWEILMRRWFCHGHWFSEGLF